MLGEGGTIASEAAILGTHAIHISTTAKCCSVFDDLGKYGLLWISESDNDALDKAIKILNKNNIKEDGKLKREKLLEDKINVTKYMIELIENYPVNSY